MQIVAVQLDIQWEDRAANHEKVRSLLSNQEITPDTLIILPEMFDAGFSMNLVASAQSEARESEIFLADLAQEKGAVVLGGVVAPVENDMGSNEAVAFDANGNELVRYRKMQPFTIGREDQFYQAGNGHQLFEYAGATISPFICYDLRFPEVFRPAAAHGAELIVVIASWPHVRSEHWVRLLQARAIENLAFVVGVNRCGADPDHQYDGRSVAFDPHGNCLFEADGKEQVCVTKIDPDEARDWRARFPALKDIRTFDGASGSHPS